MIAPEHWGRHLINISLLLRASSLSVETKCGSRRCAVSLDYPLGTDTVDWRWCKRRRNMSKQTLTFLVLLTSISHHLALLEVSTSVRASPIDGKIDFGM